MARQTAAPPKQAIAPTGAQDPDKMRQIQFQRAMDRGIASIQFDSTAWLAQFNSGYDSAKRTEAVTRLLVAIAPQTAPDPHSEPLALVRGIVLDAAYQLK